MFSCGNTSSPRHWTKPTISAPIIAPFTLPIPPIVTIQKAKITVSTSKPGLRLLRPPMATPPIPAIPLPIANTQVRRSGTFIPSKLAISFSWCKARTCNPNLVRARINQRISIVIAPNAITNTL